MKVYFYSLGCKVNSYDTETMKEQFRADGWTISPVPEGCQCIVVNSSAAADELRSGSCTCQMCFADFLNGNSYRHCNLS